MNKYSLFFRFLLLQFFTRSIKKIWIMQFFCINFWNVRYDTSSVSVLEEFKIFGSFVHNSSIKMFSFRLSKWFYMFFKASCINASNTWTSQHNPILSKIPATKPLFVRQKSSNIKTLFISSYANISKIQTSKQKFYRYYFYMNFYYIFEIA